MARPRYIICSENRLIDQSTGLVTHINVVERFKFHPVRAEGVPQNTVVCTFMMTAVWMRDDSDEDTSYEFEVLIRRPNGTVDKAHAGDFKFTRRFFRIEAGVGFSAGTRPDPGIMKMECRIRPSGTEEWMSQSFPIEIEVSDADIASEKPLSEEAEKAKK